MFLICRPMAIFRESLIKKGNMLPLESVADRGGGAFREKNGQNCRFALPLRNRGSTTGNQAWWDIRLVKFSVVTGLSVVPFRIICSLLITLSSKVPHKMYSNQNTSDPQQIANSNLFVKSLAPGAEESVNLPEAKRWPNFLLENCFL